MTVFICTLLITSMIFFNPIESSLIPSRREHEQRNENDRHLVGVHNNGSLYYPILATGPTETGSGEQAPHPQTPVRVRLLPDGRVDGVYRNGRLVYINTVQRDPETGSVQNPRHQQTPLQPPSNQQPPVRVRLLPDGRIDGVHNNVRLVHMNPMGSTADTESVYQPRYQQPRLHQTPNQQSPLPVAVAIVYNNGRPVFPVPREIPVGTAELLPDGALVFRNSSVIGRLKDEQIYESNPTGPDGHARRIKPKHGDLVINNGRPVSIYDNNSFRAYRIPPQN